MSEENEHKIISPYDHVVIKKRVGNSSEANKETTREVTTEQEATSEEAEGTNDNQ